MFPFLIIVILAVVCKLSIYNETFAVSPSFVRQEITDAPADWKIIKSPNSFFLPHHGGDSIPLTTQDGYLTGVPLARNESECKTPNGSFAVPDINAVSFISDGKTLNITIWLSDMFQGPPINATLDSFRERLQLIVVNLTKSNITTRMNSLTKYYKDSIIISQLSLGLHLIESDPLP